MATPFNTKTRLFVSSAKEEDIISAGDYLIKQSKAFKLDEGIIKSAFMAVKAGEDFDTDELDGAAQKKAGKLMLKQVKADLKAHEANKKQYEKDLENMKIQKQKEKEEAKQAIELDKKESAALLDLQLHDEQLVKATTQLTENSTELIQSKISDKFKFTKSGLITFDPENPPSKEDLAVAFATVTTMVTAGTTVADSASKAEAQIGYIAKSTMGENWVNLFSERPEDLSRIIKGVKIFETIHAMDDKRALALFAKTPFTTMRALMEFKVTSAEAESSPEVANQKNFDAKKKLVLETADLVKTRQAEGTGGPLKQREAKELVHKFKENLGLTVAVKPVFVHIMNVPSGPDGKMQAKTFFTTEKNKDVVRLSLVTFDLKGNKLRWDETKNEVVTIPLAAAPADVIAYLAANATPPEPTKEEKKAAAEAAKAEKAAAKKKGKAAPKDEQDDDDDAPVVTVKSKNKPAPKEEEEEEDEAAAEPEEDEDATAAVVEDDDAAEAEEEEEDDAPVAPKKGKAAIIEDDDD